MVASHYRLMLQNPPETTYRKGGRFQGWEGGEGEITHIVMAFDLKKEDKNK
jgi:hypothetical protein